MRYAGGERQRRHAHDHSSVTLVLRGAVEERVGTAIESGTALSVVVKPAGIEHTDLFGPAGAVTLQVALSREYESLAPPPGGRPQRWRWIHADASSRAMLRICDALRNARKLDHAPVGGTRVASFPMHLDDLVLELLASLDGEEWTSPCVAPAWLQRVRDALEESSSSIRSIAAREGVHPVALARLFRRCFGMQPTTWRRRARVRRAASLLADTADPLCEIALDADYCDQAHMTRELRAVLGATPAMIRRLGR
jgi:AraC family transcriptional regulator